MDKSHEKQKWVDLNLDGSSDSLVVNAINSLMAALPDTAFAERFKIDPTYIKKLGQSIDHWAYRDPQGNPFTGMSYSDIRHARVNLLNQSQTILNRAWGGSHNVPSEVLAIIKKAIEVDSEDVVKIDHGIAPLSGSSVMHDQITASDSASRDRLTSP